MRKAMMKKRAMAWLMAFIMIASMFMNNTYTAFANVTATASEEATTEAIANQEGKKAKGKEESPAEEKVEEATTEKAKEATTEKKEEATEATTEKQTEAKEETTTEEAKEATTEKEEEATEATTEKQTEAKEETTTEEAVTTAATTEAPAEATTAAPAEATTETATEAAFLFTKKINGVTVKITAKEGVLPAGTTAEVTPLSLEEVKELLSEETKKNGKEIVDAVMFDVVLHDAEGKEIQPDGKVEITFSNMKLDKESEEANVFRIQDNGKKVDVLKKNIDPESKKVTFKNDHFTPIGVATYALSNLSSKLYWGYRVEKTDGSAYVWPLYVDDDDGTKVAYCFNGTAAWPVPAPYDKNDQAYKDTWDKNGYRYHKIANASAEDMNYYSDYNNTAMKTNVLRTVYNGYPNNAAGIRQTYYLTNMQFRAVTQAAIWKYTDNMSLAQAQIDVTKSYAHGQIYTWTSNMTKAYNALITTSGLVTPPSNYELDLFIAQNQLRPYTNKMQNLLSTNLGEIADTEIQISIKKVWEGQQIPDSIVIHLYANNHLYRTATMTKAQGWNYTFTGLPSNIKYTVEEEPVPGFSSKVTGSAGAGFTITNTEDSKQVVISKQDIGGNEIAGAKLQITDKNGTKVTEWTSQAGKKHTVSLAPGSYTLTETLAPDGYKKATSVNFTVDENGVVRVNGKTAAQVVMVDEYEDQIVKISKQDVGGNEIAGANLEVRDAQNKLIEKWTSVAGVVHRITVQPGQYTLIETLAPNGYKVAESVAFSVDKNGTVKVNGKIVNEVTMVDQYDEHQVKISKTDVGGSEIAGAVLTVTDKDNKVIEKWTSQKDVTKTVTLKPGTYTLTETLAPDGYKKAESIVFTVDKDGKVTVDGKETDKVVMVDNSITSIHVEKKWDDNANQDGKRANEVTIHLLADNKDTGKTVVLNAGNGWKGSFENLDEYNGTKKITYTVSEATVAGYTSNISKSFDGTTFTITNTHTPETVNVEGTKTWKDNENQDGKRPLSITVILKANGVEKTTKTVTGANGWKYSFDNLPKYEKGTEIRYSVEEKTVEGYQMSVSGYNLTNTYTPEKTSISVSKTWEDNHNQDGIRPNSITVRLFADDVDTNKTVSLNKNNNWSASFTDLDEYKAGKKIVYTVKEDKVASYTSSKTTSEDGRKVNFTNTYTPETTKVEGTKSWNDKDNQDGKRPESITVVLKADGNEVSRKTVTEADGWKYSFDNLPKYSNGNVIRYSIEEINVPAGYQSDVIGFNLINNYTPNKTSVKVSKTWLDNNNQDGIRPNSITVRLYADDVLTNKAVFLNQANGWSAEFTDLDEYKAGKKIVYTVKEDTVAGYNTTIEAKQNGKEYEITNSYNPETVKVEGTKSWNDKDNQDGKRPESITVVLKVNGEEKARKTVTAADGWNYSFDNLPKYEKGTVIPYTVEEENVADGYQSVVKDFNITNNYTPGKTAVKVTKAWLDNENQDGIRPNSITVRLFADDVDTKKTASLNQANGWTADFTDLDEYKAGKKIVYSVKEDAVAGYTTTMEESQDGKQVSFTNTHNPETVKVEGTKSWNDKDNQDGKRPQNITVILKANGEEKARKTVTAADGWKYSFENLPKFEKGTKITYTVEEEVPAGYQSIVKDFNITNNYTPGKVAVQVSKSWKDNENQDGIRPTEIKVHLYADDVDTNKTVTLNEANNWSADFTDLDEYKAGKKVVYTIKEEKVEGYTTTIETKQEGRNYEITNTHNVETVDISGEKNWNDRDDLQGRRPSYIVVNLFADGVQAASKKVTADDNWKFNFTGMPKFAKGTEIVYTVTENPVEGYTTEIEGTTITNTEKTSEVEISKTDIGGKEIEGAKLTVTDQNDKIIDEWTSKEGENHKVTLQPGKYTLTETTAPKGYEVAESIEFEVDKDGKVTVDNNEVDKVTMVDAYSDQGVEISKTDIGGEEIEGAKLEITGKDASGKEIEPIKWTSKAGESHSVKVQPGTYTLTETTAPKGYEVAESIEFEVDKDGNVTVAGNKVDKVTMEDKYSDQEVEISKTDIGGKEIEGAKLSVTGKEISGKEIEAIEWTSKEGESHKVKVQPGKYTLTETTAPKGYEVAESIEFEVDKDGNVTVAGNKVDKVTMEDKYSDQEVEISKTDVGGKEIEGAKLSITGKDASGKEIEAIEWTSKEGESHKVKVQPGKYTLTETTAPKGYEVAESIEFEVDKDGKVTVAGNKVDKVTMEDKYSDQEVEISKTDIGGEEIEGAELSVTGKDASGKEIEPIKWTSKAGESHSVKVQPGTYTLTETTAPKGYEVAESIEFTVDKDGNVTVAGNKVDKVTMEDKYSDQEVEISKTDIGGKEIEGAKLSVTGKEISGKEIEAIEWTSKEGESHKVKVQPGKYTLTETTAPKGYEVAESIEFEVDKDGNVTVAGNKVDKVTMEDKYSDQEVEISKTDVGGKEIEGAKLSVTGKEESGKEIEAIEWTSKEGENHKVTLQPGTYTLTETTAPNGYEVAESITFTVNKDGVVTVDGKETDKVTMVDKQTSVKISKVDIVDASEVAGAKIQLLYKGENGEEQIFDEWISEEKPHEITGLTTGVEYTLRETVAPKGYKLTSDTTFKLDEKGKVSESTTKMNEDGVLLVEDEREDKASLKVTKKLVKLDTDELLYVKDITFYVGLFEDAEFTKPVGEPKALQFKNQASSTVLFDEGVTAGKTYYISEVDADGKPMQSGEYKGVSYSAEYPDNQMITIEPEKTSEYEFKNVFVDYPEGYRNAGIKITKKVEDQDGNAVDSNETFYAGIFSDEECTTLSEDVDNNIIPLEMNGNSETTVNVPVKLQDVQELNFYIAEVDQDGNLVENDDEFAYSVDYSNNKLTLTSEKSSGETVITNITEEEKTTETEKPEKTTKTKTPTHSKTSTPGRTTRSYHNAKTGDDSMTAAWILLMLASLTGIGCLVVRKRKKEN